MIAQNQPTMAVSTQNSATPYFLGEFGHAIDGKNRITIPSQWRFEEAVELYIFPSSSARCLTVMPRAEIDRIRAEASALPGHQRKAALRHIGAEGRQATLDKNGRLSLPADLCERLHLSGSAKLSGSIDTFEIWNTGDWEAARPAHKAVSDPILADLGL